MGPNTTAALGFLCGVAFYAAAWMLAFASHSFYKEQKGWQWLGCLTIAALLNFFSWASLLLAYKSATQ